MAVFERDIQVRFAHCDPAGIIFYPRYFEIINGVIEDWCAEGLGYPFRRMHMEGRHGVPIVSMEVVFENPSRLGDMLRFTVAVKRLGNKSVTLDIAADCDDEPRMRCRQVLVHSAMGRDVRAEAWPADVKLRMAEFLHPNEETS